MIVFFAMLKAKITEDSISDVSLIKDNCWVSGKFGFCL